VNTVVPLILAGGIVSILIGIVMAWLAAVFEEKRYPMVMAAGPVYWSYALWTFLLGVVLMLSPAYWYGPSWSYFPQLPHNGFGMGMCCSILAALLMIALRLNAHARILSVLFFLIGLVYWTAGIILGAEGLLGHQGLMEALFMMPWGAIAFTISAILMVYRR
jgi:hypothetical protein